MQTRDQKEIARTNATAGWAAWFVFCTGGLVTIAAIWLTVTNPARETIFFVLAPGIAVGLVLMFLGHLGVSVTQQPTRPG